MAHEHLFCISTRAQPHGDDNGDYRESFIAAARTHIATAAHTRTHDQHPQLTHDALRRDRHGRLAAGPSPPLHSLTEPG
jgi:hypothetical protein